METKILDTDALRERTIALLQHAQRVTERVDKLKNPAEKMWEIANVAQEIYDLAQTFAFAAELRNLSSVVLSELEIKHRAHSTIFATEQTWPVLEESGQPLRELLGENAWGEILDTWAVVAIPEYIGEEDIPF